MKFTWTLAICATTVSMKICLLLSSTIKLGPADINSKPHVVDSAFVKLILTQLDNSSLLHLWLYMFFSPQDQALWACLAAMGSYAKELNTVEVAYAAIDAVSIQRFQRHLYK